MKHVQFQQILLKQVQKLSEEHKEMRWYTHKLDHVSPCFLWKPGQKHYPQATFNAENGYLWKSLQSFLSYKGIRWKGMQLGFSPLYYLWHMSEAMNRGNLQGFSSNCPSSYKFFKLLLCILLTNRTSTIGFHIFNSSISLFVLPETFSE